MAPTVQHIPLDSLRPLYAAFDAKQMAIIEDAQAFVRAHPGFTPPCIGPSDPIGQVPGLYGGRQPVGIGL